MTIEPNDFVGRPLVELLDAMRRNPSFPTQLGGDLRLHHPGEGLTTVDGDTKLPLDHPPVEIPGVVLERFLGSGGQGCVYAGRVTATNKIVAVKLLSSSAANGVREAILASRVRHPNVLRILRAQPVGAQWVVLMELVVGQELRHRPNLNTRSVFSMLASALSAVGSARLVHRDIKPANIIVRDSDESPVLIDFGLAIDLGDELDQFDSASGTPFFLPPEAWRGARPEPSWDAYALGVTVASLLGDQMKISYELSSLRSAKLSGKFDQAVNEVLSAIPDLALRDWAVRLVAAMPKIRLPALQVARDWLAA